MTLTTTRQKVTEALELLRQGNPHAANETLAPLIFQGPAGDAAAKAANWITMGYPLLARTELEGYLRKTSFESVTAEIRKEIRGI